MTNAAINNRAVTGSAAADLQPQSYSDAVSLLSLGIAPVVFSSETFHIGRLDSEQHEPIKELRRQNGKTHAFRFDSRNDKIANIAMGPGIEPMWDVSEVRVGENLLLLAEAIEHQLRRWFFRSRTILRQSRPLICLGRRDRLLSNALEQLGVQNPDRRLDVVAKWSFDLRLLVPADPDYPPWLGLIADVGTANVIDITVSELIRLGVNPLGHYVGLLAGLDEPAPASHLRLLGQVAEVEGDCLVLDDVRGDAASNRVAAAEVFIEARPENLEAVLRALYPRAAADALAKLRRTRAPYLSGDRKLDKIRATIENLNRSLGNTDKKALRLTFGDGLSASFGALLDQSDPRFPRMIETTRPAMLFGPSGHDQASQSRSPKSEVALYAVLRALAAAHWRPVSP